MAGWKVENIFFTFDHSFTIKVYYIFNWLEYNFIKILQ